MSNRDWIKTQRASRLFCIPLFLSLVVPFTLLAHGISLVPLRQRRPNISALQPGKRVVIAGGRASPRRLPPPMAISTDTAASAAAHPRCSPIDRPLHRTSRAAPAPTPPPPSRRQRRRPIRPSRYRDRSSRRPSRRRPRRRREAGGTAVLLVLPGEETVVNVPRVGIEHVILRVRLSLNQRAVPVLVVHAAPSRIPQHEVRHRPSETWRTSREPGDRRRGSSDRPRRRRDRRRGRSSPSPRYR